MVLEVSGETTRTKIWVIFSFQLCDDIKMMKFSYISVGLR